MAKLDSDSTEQVSAGQRQNLTRRWVEARASSLQVSVLVPRRGVVAALVLGGHPSMLPNVLLGRLASKAPGGLGAGGLGVDPVEDVDSVVNAPPSSWLRGRGFVGVSSVLMA